MIGTFPILCETAAELKKEWQEEQDRRRAEYVEKHPNRGAPYVPGCIPMGY